MCLENELFFGWFKFEKNVSFGGVKFVKYDEIEICNYIKEDIIYIKILVDCDGLSEL